MSKTRQQIYRPLIWKYTIFYIPLILTPLPAGSLTTLSITDTLFNIF